MIQRLQFVIWKTLMVGIAGDSIVVCPSQTLTNKDIRCYVIVRLKLSVH